LIFTFESGAGYTFAEIDYEGTSDRVTLEDSWDTGAAASRMAEGTPPYYNGRNYYGQTLESREVILSYALESDTRDHLFALVRNLKTIFNPLDGAGVLTQTMDDGITAFCLDVVINGEPVCPPGKQNRKHWFQRFIVRMKAPIPFWYAPTRHMLNFQSFVGGMTLPLTLPMNFGEAGSSTEAINAGNVPTPLYVVFTGYILNPCLSLGYEDDPNYKEIRINQEILEGETLVINTAQGNHTVDWFDAFGTPTNGFGYLDPSSEFFWLLPGYNYLTYATSESVGTGASCTVYWYDRYLGV